VTKIKCSYCQLEQAPAARCTNVACGRRFARYVCTICHIYEDAPKSIYHCHDCGICRVGRPGEYMHCPTCNACVR